jgi:signal transduction histidine kinase
VFDEFYRVRGEQSASITGTGLGLSLVKRLTELHEGTVTLNSALEEGSEFTVRIPAAQAASGPGQGTANPDLTVADPR